MDDLFEREQQIYDEAVSYLKSRDPDAPLEPGKYELLVKEYGKLLKHLRMVTKISDRTTVSLNTSKLNLLDKVHYDALTGIYNRRFLIERMEQVVKGLIGLPFSVMMADVDFFKRYNDVYGHSMGDDCLRAVAKALDAAVKGPQAFAARYGGEEFAILLPNTGADGACELAQSILESVRALQIPHEKNEAADYVTISLGVTSGQVEHNRTGDDYIRQADKALYLSKASGRNRYTFLEFMEEAK